MVQNSSNDEYMAFELRAKMIKEKSIAYLNEINQKYPITYLNDNNVTVIEYPDGKIKYLRRY